MADNEEKTKVESAEDGKGEQPPAKGKSKMLLFIIIGVVALVLGVGGGMYMSGSSSSSQDEETVAEASQKPEKEAKSHKSKSEKKKKKKEKKEKSGEGESGGEGSIIFAIKDIVVNPAGTGGSRFLSVSFGFELASTELESEFEDRESLVRDALITILSSKTVSQLTDSKQKEIMRYQVRRRLSKLLDTDGLEGVYFTDFVLQ